MGSNYKGGDILQDKMIVVEDVVPAVVNYHHPAIGSLVNFFKEGLNLVEMMKNNPGMELEDAIQKVVSMEPALVRIIPVWDSLLGWRFFFLYNDGTRVETGNVWKPGE